MKIVQADKSGLPDVLSSVIRSSTSRYQKATMPAILFVCTANQFRSPIAAAYFAQKLTTSGSHDTWTVASAGTWATPGLPAHPQAIKTAAAYGLDLKNHRTQEVTGSLLSAFDLVVVMEEGHLQALVTEFPETAGKIVVLGKVASVPGVEIPDPAKTGFSKPEETAALVCSSIQRTFSKLVQFTLLQHDGYSALIP